MVRNPRFIHTVIVVKEEVRLSRQLNPAMLWIVLIAKCEDLAPWRMDKYRARINHI